MSCGVHQFFRNNFSNNIHHWAYAIWHLSETPQTLIVLAPQPDTRYQEQWFAIVVLDTVCLVGKNDCMSGEFSKILTYPPPQATARLQKTRQQLAAVEKERDRCLSEVLVCGRGCFFTNGVFTNMIDWYILSMRVFFYGCLFTTERARVVSPLFPVDFPRSPDPLTAFICTEPGGG